MIYYIKVTPEVARRFCNPVLRNRTKDGNILLWMGDLNQVPGDTLKERANYVGGALLTTNQANDEYWGYTDDLAGCYTPDYSGGQKDNDTSGSEATDKGSEETSEDDEADGNNKEKEA